MRRMESSVLVILLACVAGMGCAHSVDATDGERPPSVSLVRGDEPFGALVARLDAIAEEPARTVEPCLVRATTDGLRITADLAPAITPMPAVDADAIAVARAANTIRVASRYGVDGDSGPYVATFTRHPPATEGLVIVVFVERDSVFLRSTREAGPREDGIGIDRVGDRVRDATSASHALVVVAASPDTPFARIGEALAAMRAVETPFALGVAFTTNETLIARPGRPDDGVGLCETLPPSSSERGSLPVSDLRDSVESLRREVASCSERADPRIYARGGRIRVAIRIDARGRATERCAVEDGLRDAPFRACLLDAVGAHAWPIPEAGIVDVTFPLVVRTSTEGTSAAICWE